MIEILPHNIKDQCEVAVPGSKSFTHRILIASALSEGLCSIENALLSEDTVLTIKGLRQMGIRIEEKPGNRLMVYGCAGDLQPSLEPIYLGNSGTSIRLLTAVAALGKDNYTLLGNDRMAQRPIQALIDALQQIGVQARSAEHSGCPPVEVNGKNLSGTTAAVNCRTSSQYLSGLLLMAPCTAKGLLIKVTEGPVSRPYVDMTIDVMSKFGIAVDRQGYERFQVAGKQAYRAGAYKVEADGSQAGYFWAAAAVCRKALRLRGLSRSPVRETLIFQGFWSPWVVRSSTNLTELQCQAETGCRPLKSIWVTCRTWFPRWRLWLPLRRGPPSLKTFPT